MGLLKRIGTIVLALAGISLSVLTIVQHVSYYVLPSRDPSYCNFSETINCAAVIASPFSSLFGLPLGSYGIVFYAIVLVLALTASAGRGTVPGAVSQRPQEGALSLLALGAVLLSVALFIISKFVIKAICPVCLSLYVVNFLLFLLYAQHCRSLVVRREFRAILSGLTAPRGKLVALLAVVVSSALVGLSLPELLTKRELKKLSAVTSALTEQWSAMPVQNVPVNFDPGELVDYAKGDPRSKIQVVEFSDFECPACRRFSEIVFSLSAKYGDRVLFVHKDFPIDNSCNPLITNKAHEHSCYMASVARCAGEQGKFWEVAELLFTLPELGEDVPAEKLRGAIGDGLEKLGLAPEQIEECLASGRPTKKLLESIQLGADLGLQGTPSVWVNGKKLSKPTEESLSAVIDSLLMR